MEDYSHKKYTAKGIVKSFLSFYIGVEVEEAS